MCFVAVDDDDVWFVGSFFICLFAGFLIVNKIVHFRQKKENKILKRLSCGWGK